MYFDQFYHMNNIFRRSLSYEVKHKVAFNFKALIFTWMSEILITLGECIYYMKEINGL
jgi:hypothetical protein